MMVRADLLSGFSMDIGGTKARIYEFTSGCRADHLEIDLPEIDSGLSLAENSQRRVGAISRLVGYFGDRRQLTRVATACAGLKDEARTGVTLLHFGVPLPELTLKVKEETGVDIGPLFDDDVAAAWGHLVSSQSPLGQDAAKNTILLTAGTGLAEAHYIQGSFIDKTSYPRASVAGLEERLRAKGWEEDGDPSRALVELVHWRRELYPVHQLILSGRFIHMDRCALKPLAKELGLEVHLVDLPEAPALGALYLQQAAVC